MPNVVLSPNMSLPVPIVSVDIGPDWANNINASLSIVDQHNHSPGSGVLINQNGIGLIPNAVTFDALSFNSSNAYGLRSVKFTPQGAPLALVTDIGCLYESGVDLYYNDGSGNQIQMTSGGSIVGAGGTIGGLPSGTASVSYSTGTYTFQKATSTSAAIAVGPVIISQEVASANAITIQSPNSLASSYAITLPIALPGASSFVLMDSGGNLSLSAASSLTLTTLTVTTINGSPTINALTVSGNATVDGTLTIGTGGSASILTANAAGLELMANTGIVFPNAATGAGIYSGNTVNKLEVAAGNGSSVHRPLVVSAQTSNTGLEIVRGRVGAGGSTLLSGEGATVVYNGTSSYTVTFTDSFFDAAVVVLTPFENVGGTRTIDCHLTAIGGASFTCFVEDTISGVLGFTFIAIGQRNT